MFYVNTRELGNYDIVVCGGGIAGAATAIAAAREGSSVALIEKAGSLGGTLTEGFMPIIHDSDNKGGIVRELFDFLNLHNMTCTRYGSPTDAEGKRIPGFMVDTEGCKYFLDKACIEAGVKVFFHSQIAAVNKNGDSITDLLVATECGNYSVRAKIVIDASGNGIVADMAGCSWDCGDPFEKRPSPTSYSVCVVGMPEDYNGTETGDDKTAYSNMLRDNGITVSAGQASVRKLPSLKTWTMGINFQYGVMPDDINTLSKAVLDGRQEAFEVIEKHKRIPGYEDLYIAFTNSHIGVREGRRIYGEYRLNDDDILAGRRFDDGICLVKFGVDVHKLKSDDTLDCKRGFRTKPYNIPYGCLVAKECDNLMLAGRCISGDFYPHASYRVMGNMAATGEACGFAAAKCVKENTLPRDFDGRRAKEFMAKRGYEL